MKHFCIALSAAAALFTTPAVAAFECGGPLVTSDRDGLAALFTPAYSPKLTHTGGAITDDNFSRQLTQAEMQRLQTAVPTLATSATLSASSAKALKDILNQRAQDQVPGWLTTGVGAFVPQPWVGIGADVAVQLINGVGDAGRLTLANVAGTVSPGGLVTVHEIVAPGKNGNPEFVWHIAYTATLNGKPTVALLSSCKADVVQVSASRADGPSRNMLAHDQRLLKLDGVVLSAPGPAISVKA
ncbi:hypothetical protein [Cupriavidus oxalaticus]|uniref:Uncharacterized protein n=1 Tax=Cupriavidus oxalaticus TaxID=96344 RepID=A0A4P7LH79_9BURK|nr:hypothetical protein [Cupriavidus oxalaticus]QBY55496.1 hypothetical protein E0W60_31210 [Cupriavidus oxalaticus]